MRGANVANLEYGFGFPWRSAGRCIPAIAFLVGVAGCASSGIPLMSLDGVARNSEVKHLVGIRVVPPEVPVSKSVEIEVVTGRSGYLYLFQLGTDNKALSLVFPNQVDQVNHVESGKTRLPRPSWRLAAQGPAGHGYMLAVVSESPQDMEMLRTQLGKNKIRLKGPYGAAVAAYREIDSGGP